MCYEGSKMKFGLEDEVEDGEKVLEVWISLLYIPAFSTSLEVRCPRAPNAMTVMMM